jgi:hypothetical protein
VNSILQIATGEQMLSGVSQLKKNDHSKKNLELMEHVQMRTLFKLVETKNHEKHKNEQLFLNNGTNC